MYKSCYDDELRNGSGGPRGGIQDSSRGYDTASLFLTNNFISERGNEFNFTYTLVSKNCYKCTPTNITTLAFNTTYDIEVSTTFPLTLGVLRDDSNQSSVCKPVTHHFREGSIFTYIVTHNSSKPHHIQCYLGMLEKGDHAFLPIVYAAATIVPLAFIWMILVGSYKVAYDRGIFKYFHFSLADRLTHRDLGLPRPPDPSIKRYHGTATTKDESQPILSSSYNSSVNAGRPAQDRITGEVIILRDTEQSSKPKRLVSLDAFRGMSLVVMIFVNYGGGGYWFFDHSIWNGLTVADLVFPWFVWIMGVSLVFSFHGRRKDSFLKTLYQILRRTVILFAIGLFLNASASRPLSQLRIPGVLQRFSITYLVVATTELLTAPLYKKKKFLCWKPLRDVTSNWVQWAMIIIFEALWLMLTFLIHENGCPRGYLGPGGFAEHGRYRNCTGGAAGTIDRWLLKNQHLYDSPTAKDLYQLHLNYDPEGILGSLNSVVLCYLGVQAGKTLLHFRGKHLSILGRFLIWSIVLGMLGTLLCLGQKNAGLIPLNKNLWSLSFILVMAGTGYLVLALFYLTIDTLRLWNGSPFRFPGSNSIIVYVGHSLLEGYFPFSVYNQEKTHLTFLASNLVAVSLWILISYYWHCIEFFVKI